GQRGPVTAKEVGDIGIVKDAAVVGQYLGSQRMYSAQEVLDVVYARISTYFVMMEQMVKEENDALTQANADAAARVHVPDPSEHVPNIAAIQAANAGTLTVAWVEMQGNIGSYSQEVRDSLTVAVAAAGFTDVAGETNAGTVQRGAALSSRSYLLSAESWTRNELILVNGERTDKEEIFIRPKSSFELTFTLERPSMVNFWAEPGLLDSSGGVPVNLDLVLSGTTTDGKSVRYSTTKSGGAGESISSVLPSGTYSLLVIDKTDYSQSLSDVQTLPSIKAPVGINIQKYNTANIEGQISIPERNETMPVSMSVAEFETNGKRNLNYDGSDLAKKSVNKLDSNKPVSVIIHGRANSEDSSQIAELVRNLQAQGIQVVTLDWHEGAEDNRTPISLEGSQWIVTVGTWAANQLKAAGFTGTNIDVIGHSWGSYVGYEIGAHIPGGVRTLVALDPAADTWLLGGEKYEGFSNPQFSFSIVAANSYAFHSSNFSNRNFALSAEYSFDVVAPENYENSIVGPLEIGLTMTQHYLAALGIEGLDEIRDAMNEHPFAISLFTELLKRQNGNPSDIAARAFSLENLRSNSPEFLVRPDNYEGTFFVNPTLVPNTIGSEAGQNVWKAINFGFRSKDATGNDIIQAQ
ncbi:MAG TPA: alpha/beta fold hydrolase, partial [Candidatus Nanoarchaeia archaeon]|nr:alpha/beta fold hydrolase [Candidatus Nanoarchaeia archaeon]